MTKVHSIYSKISREELKRWEAAFFEPAMPMDLAVRVDQLGRLLGDHAVDTPQAEFWRTAFNASKFALHRKATCVQLLRPHKTGTGLIPPDFEIVSGGVSARYEIVEALSPGRRRDEEYRYDRVHGPEARTEEVPTPEQVQDILATTCQIKVRKAHRYERATGLVIALNVWSLMEEQRERRVWTEGTAEAGCVFDEVWMLKGGASWLVWYHRQAAMLWHRR